VELEGDPGDLVAAPHDVQKRPVRPGDRVLGHRQRRQRVPVVEVVHLEGAGQLDRRSDGREE